MREERQRLELTQEQLAKAGGITRNTQWGYENHAFNPSVRYLSNLISVGVDSYYVLMGERKKVISKEVNPELLRLVELYQRLGRVDRGALFRMAWAFSRVSMRSE